MPVPPIGFQFDFDANHLRRAHEEAARHMEAIRAMGGFTAFERTYEQLCQAAEAMHMHQEHIANMLAPTVLRITEDHQRMMKLIQEHAAPLQRMIEDVDRSLSPFRRTVLELAQSAALNAFQATAIRASIPSDFLMASLAAPVDAIFDAEREELPDRVGVIEDVLKECVQGSSSSETTSSMWLGIILSIILFVLARGENAIHNEDHRAFLESELHEMEQRLIVEIQANAPAELSASVSLFVVQRDAVVKSAPRSRSKERGTVYTDQLVASTNEKRRWVEIEYLDIDRGRAQRGWVLKKYLDRVPRR